MDRGPQKFIHWERCGRGWVSVSSIYRLDPYLEPKVRSEKEGRTPGVKT